MAYPIYTTRFIYVTASGVEVSYVVPGGYRAVLMTLMVSNNAGVANTFSCYLSGTLIWRRLVPASESSSVTDLRIALYSGERLSADCSGASSRMIAAGYLFREVAGRAGPPATTERAASADLEGQELPSAA